MSHHKRIATSWAAMTLLRAGYVLHSTADGWDVEHPDGSWTGCNSWQELCALAHRV